MAIVVEWQFARDNAREGRLSGAYSRIPQRVRTRDHGAVLGRRHHLSAAGCPETSGRRHLDRRQRSSARLRRAGAADPDDGAAALIRGHAHALPTRFDARLKAEIEVHGPIRHLVAPNIAHWSFLAEW